MPSYRTGRVVALLSERPGLGRYEVEFDPPLPTGHPAMASDRAYALVDVSGPVTPGHRVLLNTTAVELGLGTGGWHVVVCDLDQPGWVQPGPGHIIKLRYTGLQVDTGAVDEHEPPDASGTGRRPHLDGLPVAVGTLHSQVPTIAAAFHDARPDARLAYVMTDGAALPLALSDLVVQLRSLGLVDLTVTAGHAFGGDLEAVNVPSALVAAARHGADAVVVAMGPGVVGTGTRLGTTAIEAAPALDAVAALRGRPVFCARYSSSDARARHVGLSHHAATVLDLVRSAVEVPVPPAIVGDLAGVGDGRHDIVAVEPPDVAALLDRHGLHVTTMGRGPEQEPEFFAVCGSVGLHLASAVPT